MYLEKMRGAPYIRTKKEENPTSNRCGIHICKTTKSISNSQVIISASQLLKQWEDLHVHPSPVQEKTTSPDKVTWFSPMPSYLKCNVDCELFEDQGRIGMGMVLRDHPGGFLAAKANSAYGPMDALVAEALSCTAALQWLRINNYRNVLLETDSLLLASAVNNPTPYLSSIGLIIQDCKDLLRVILECWISFVRRLANQAAHLLA